jgi:aspartokinase/homoserine dehydrogenase 1
MNALKHPAGAVIAYKFGGSSLASAERIRHVAAILRAREPQYQVVVVSAMQGVTNALIELTRLAAAGDVLWRSQLEALRLRHVESARALLGEQAAPVLEQLENESRSLGDLLQALVVLKSVPQGAAEWASGLGEVWNARQLAALLECPLLDAREVLQVHNGEMGVQVDWEASERLLAAWRGRHDLGQRVLVTGFVARDSDGRATTLGRNGSDYSGAIFGVLFDAERIEIWTDVDGVLSADPKRVPEARVVDRMSFEEAFELAFFGAKVIHPQTLWPATRKAIPIYIKNTFNPAHPGTRIDETGAPQPPIKGITCVENLSLVEVRGAGMVGVPGTAARVFASLRGEGISATMIAQASSEHSISCAVPGAQSARAVVVLKRAFAQELEAGQLQTVQAHDDMALLAIVGDGMAGAPGTAGRLFGALGRAGINVRAIAQGGSERNITVAIDQREATRALRAVHAGFYLSPQTLSVGLIGPGQVGRALLDQLDKARARLAQTTHLELKVRAISGRGRLWTSDDHLGVAALDQPAAAGDLDAFANQVQADFLPHALIVDCSASDAVAARYPEWIARGIHVVTPNKHAGSGDPARYQRIFAACSEHGTRFRYEATVGAGLPVIGTLRDLLDTGDEVTSIEGIFSGTLGFLFHKFDGAEAFSTLVGQARAAGYTEPDPRDDLRGTDVARKLTILARELGWMLELADVEVESLVPAALESANVDEFLSGLSAFDEPMRERVQSAHARDHVLRYVARLDVLGKRASVRLTELPRSHPFAHTRATDNIVQFTTRRYSVNPMIVQGPGAGPEVTAAGVFADILRIAAGLGARL